jgi:DNA (cytosine-5)-methyltransferase 1
MSGKSTYRVIDLFSGAGGLSQGFVMVPYHRFRTVWANDIDTDAAESYAVNFGTPCVLGDISAILADKRIRIPKADVVIGGPPCQGFSLLNKKREGDARRQLWQPFLEIVRRTGASAFVMENVPQLLGSEEYHEIVESAERLGFEVCSAKLTACDYGVPQVRARAFIVGSQLVDLLSSEADALGYCG